MKFGVVFNQLILSIQTQLNMIKAITTHFHHSIEV